MSEYDWKTRLYGLGPRYGGHEEDERPSYTQEVEERWRRFVIRARRWNAAHPELVDEFNKLTGGECVMRSGQLSPKLVRTWQKRHGLSGDGMVNEKTLAAARSNQSAKRSSPPEQKSGELKDSPEEMISNGEKKDGGPSHDEAHATRYKLNKEETKRWLLARPRVQVLLAQRDGQIRDCPTRQHLQHSK